MGKPILFDTISRKKFNDLSDDIKAKRNYQIKEEDGSISKHIAGLEGAGGAGAKIFNVEAVKVSGADPGEWEYHTEATCGEIDEYWNNNGEFKIYCSNALLGTNPTGEGGMFAPIYVDVQAMFSPIESLHVYPLPSIALSGSNIIYTVGYMEPVGEGEYEGKYRIRDLWK